MFDYLLSLSDLFHDLVPLFLGSASGDKDTAESLAEEAEHWHFPEGFLGGEGQVEGRQQDFNVGK